MQNKENANTSNNKQGEGESAPDSPVKAYEKVF